MIEGQLIPSLLAVCACCVRCGQQIHGEARAVILRRPTQFPEDAERVWLLSRSDSAIIEKLCRAKSCASYLDAPVMPPNPAGVVYEGSIFYRNHSVRFVGGPVVEVTWPIRVPMFLQDARSQQMTRFLKDGSGLRKFCDYMDDHEGLRCVGFWSGQEEIDAVHHYACLFAQETSKATGIWMPYWFRDARLIGTNRVAYLIKGSESYQGAVVMDTLGYQTLTWVWLTPRLRRRGIFSRVWRLLEHTHPGFKVLAPLSRTMQSFLKHKDPVKAHEVVTETGSRNV